MTPIKIQLRRKITATLFVMLILLGVVFFRLAYVQIVKGDYWSTRAADSRIKEVPVVAQRGIIYDRNMKKLAVSISADSIAASPTAVVKSGQQDKTAATLAEILNMDKNSVLTKITSGRGFEWIKRKATFEQARAVLEADLPGISIVNEPQRFYPKENLAGQLLGFAGIDNQGLEGIEKAFDDILKGTDGSMLSEYDGRNNEVPQTTHRYVPAEDGNSIVLTIDESIQYFCEREIANIMSSPTPPKSVGILIMNPKTGEILAMAQSGAGDPNNRGLYDSSAFRNMLVADSYEPGSTFKIITAATALENNVVTLNDRFYDPGYHMIGSQRIRCWRYYDPHGDQSFAEALRNSCNPAFIQIGLRIEEKEKGLFYKYIRAFGFGQSTNLGLLGESSGIMIKESQLKTIDIATISIGQSIAVTPLQMVTAVSAVANGGTLLKPQIIRQIIDNDGNTVQDFAVEEVRQVISKETSDTMKMLLEEVVAKGTARNAYIEGYRVAGKTGTAQKVAPTGGYADGKYVASFIGFAPANDPQIVALILIDEPSGALYQGGQVAAPVFAAVVGDVLRYLGVPLQVSGDGTQTTSAAVEKKINVPDLTNLSQEAAKQVLSLYGLTYNIKGSGAKITGQSPAVNTEISIGGTVTLQTGTGSDKIIVPDLTGRRLREAVDILSAMGLKISTEGSGLVHEQNPRPGSAVSFGSSVKVTFESEVLNPEVIGP